jgi:hypothetical protein
MVVKLKKRRIGKKKYPFHQPIRRQHIAEILLKVALKHQKSKIKLKS